MGSLARRADRGVILHLLVSEMSQSLLQNRQRLAALPFFGKGHSSQRGGHRIIGGRFRKRLGTGQSSEQHSKTKTIEDRCKFLNMTSEDDIGVCGIIA